MQTNETLIEQLRSGEGDEQQIMLQLFQQNRPLIYKVIEPYLQHQAALDEDDLMQEAFFGICEAAARFDPGRGVRFSTYMQHWVRASVSRPFHAANRADRVPEHMQQKLIAYNRMVAEYRQQIGADPPDYLIQIRLQLSQEQLEQLKQVNQRGRVVSLSDPVPGTDGVTIADMLPDSHDRITETCDELDAERDAAELWGQVDQLDHRQAQALRIRYQDNLTVREIAEQMQLTPGKVRDAIARGCQKLARKKTVRRIAKDRGFLPTHDLYGGGLQRYLHTGMSCIEASVIRRLDGE